MNILRGVIPVLPTPFTTEGERVDRDAVAALAAHAIDEGANALALFGAGGEFYKLTPEEKRDIVGIVRRVCRGMVPLVATVSAHATRQAIAESRELQAAGADVLNIMPPSFGFPTNDMIREHVIQVAGAVSMPVMIQYAPALTGGTISNETFARISDETRQELYIKIEANPTGPAISALRDATAGRYGIIVGNAGECLYEALLRGACAVMPGTALVKPYAMIYRAFAEGDRDRAFELFNDFLPYIHFIQRPIEQFVAMEKIILVERGLIPLAHCRQPAMQPDDITVGLLKEYYRVVKKKFEL